MKKKISKSAMVSFIINFIRYIFYFILSCLLPAGYINIFFPTQYWKNSGNFMHSFEIIHPFSESFPLKKSWFLLDKEIVVLTFSWNCCENYKYDLRISSHILLVKIDCKLTFYFTKICVSIVENVRPLET